MKTKFFSAFLGAAFMLFFAASSYAAPVVTIFAGSSGAFESFGVASTVSAVCGNATNFWSQGSTAGNGGQDANSSPLEKGSLWIAWDGAADGSTATHVCAYLSVDSIVGNRLYFSANGANRSTLVLGGTFANGNKVPQVPDTVATLPANIIADLNGQQITAGVSDIRPEDAQFATSRVRSSLGWGNNPVCSAFTATSAQTIAFSIAGNDPISGSPVPTYTALNVGAYPVMFFYNKSAVANPGDLGNLKPTDINSHNIAAIWGGLTGQTTDLGHFAPGTYPIGGGAGSIAGRPLFVLVREPISGTYNTVNFQAVHNSGTALDQETIFPAPVANACAGPFPPTSPSGNPSYVTTAKGTTYARAIGTGEVVKQAGLNANALGYGFWSFSTYAGTSATLSYLTVDGVDPLETAPTGGSFPQCVGAICPVLPLTGVVNGSYRVWNIIRVMTSPAEAAGNVGTFVSNAQNQTVAPTVHPVTDFVPFVANGEQYLSVYRSHYSGPNLAALGVTPVCTATTNINTPVNGPVPPGAIGCPEGGGDMAGAVFTWGADIDAFLLSGSELINFIQ
ncbi:MAG TPA: hypothetical protein VGH37_15490 [Candidatus Acidoferrum sp.]|jgi:hypothetical protein